MESRISTPEEMIGLGAGAARSAKPGTVFGLIGNMGAGKTHWTKGFLQSRQPSALVTSPTFSLINEYRDGEIPIYHFDFYRIDSPRDLLSLGWDEYIEAGGIVICEWADRYPDLMPEGTHWLEFSHQPDGSRLVRAVRKPKSPATY